jgi:hypothetical protein
MPAMNCREMLKITALVLQGRRFKSSMVADTAGVVHHQKARESFVPVENVIVRLRLRRMIKVVTLMRSGADVAMKQDGEWIAVTVPRLLVYEAIRVDVA